MTRSTPRLPSPVRFPCLTDTASVDGLAALQRSHPKTWARLLHRGATAPQVDLHSTMGDVVGTALDIDALPRSTRDQGRLRQARWCAATLVRQYPELAVLDLDVPTAEWIEQDLIRRGTAPSSARKVRSHALRLRRSVGRRLGLKPEPSRPTPSATNSWDPRLDYRTYAGIRDGLSWHLAIATDLLVTCRLRPATVLALRADDVRADGAQVRVRGRKRRWVLPVPAFLRSDLATLARGAGGKAPLFPGRTRAGTLGVATLRRRLQAAALEADVDSVDLRDLSDLAATVLGPGSGTPRGRRSALSRLAPRWVQLGDPPVRHPMPQEAAEARNDRHAEALEDLERRAAESEAIADLTRRVTESEARSARLESLVQARTKALGREQRGLTRALERMESTVSTPVAPASADRVSRRVAKLEKWAKADSDRGKTARKRRNTLAARISADRDITDRHEKLLTTLRGDIRVLTAMVCALGLERVIDLGGPASIPAAWNRLIQAADDADEGVT